MAYIPINIEESVKRECRRRRYSDKTSEIYIYCISRFLKFAGKTIDRISKKDVRLFLEHLSEKGMAGNTMNTYHMAVRFLFEEILGKRIWIDIRYSKVPEKLPVALAKDETKRLFDSIENEKHRLMIQLMYSAGLRLSELINLKAQDIDFRNSFGFVRKGKGSKDRIFILSEKLKNPLKDLVEKEGIEEKNFLFRSGRNDQYSQRTVQQIIKMGSRKAGIKKRVTPHTLRHSFATHLIEDGCSVSEVQALLGHKSPETTMVYVHLASPRMINVKSPLDSL